MGERKVAEKIQCDKTQIQSILLKKEEIIKYFEANVSSKKKRCKGVNNNEIEKTLLDWFWKGRSKNIPVTGSMLQEKARRIADALSLSQEDFKASNRWLDRFKNRNGIKAKYICKNGRGNSRLMEETTSTYFTRMGAIWNMDETAQFFRALPSHVVARAQKDRKSV